MSSFGARPRRTMAVSVRSASTSLDHRRTPKPGRQRHPFAGSRLLGFPCWAIAGAHDDGDARMPRRVYLRPLRLGFHRRRRYGLQQVAAPKLPRPPGVPFPTASLALPIAPPPPGRCARLVLGPPHVLRSTPKRGNSSPARVDRALADDVDVDPHLLALPSWGSEAGLSLELGVSSISVSRCSIAFVSDCMSTTTAYEPIDVGTNNQGPPLRPIAQHAVRSQPPLPLAGQLRRVGRDSGPPALGSVGAGPT